VEVAETGAGGGGDEGGLAEAVEELKKGAKPPVEEVAKGAWWRR